MSEKEYEMGGVKFKPLAFGGHSLLCRQCVQGEQVGNDELERALNGIMLPKQYAARSNWLVVVAWGPKVGTPCTKNHMKRFKRARFLDHYANVGDQILCANTPEGCDGIRLAPWSTSMYFIEESVPLAIYRPEVE